jgi:hypothetical protein
VLHIARVQILELRLGDLTQLRLREPANLLPVRFCRALVERQRLLDQHGCGRSLGDEGERAVLEDGDLDGDDASVLLLSLGVEGFAELHDVDAVLAERGTDRRGGVRLPAGDLQLDEREDFLGHERVAG